MLGGVRPMDKERKLVNVQRNPRQVARDKYCKKRPSRV